MELPADIEQACGAAILPVGATEQHGPHMGCGMDAVLADRLCAAVAARTGVPALPTLPYGCSLGHSRRWPGTLSVQPITLIELVKQIGDWAYYAGVRRLFIVNTHVTNAAPLRCALEMLRAAGISEDKVKLTINHSTAANSLREEDVSRVLEYDVFWRIPHDLNVSSSTQLGQPIVIAKPYARVSRSIIDLTHTLTGTRTEKRGFLDRVLGRSA